MCSCQKQRLGSEQRTDSLARCHFLSWFSTTSVVKQVFFFLFFILFLEIQISYLWHARHRPEKCWLHSDFPGSILAGSCMERLQSCTRVADCPCWLAMGDRQHLSAPAYWWHLKQKWISPKSLILSCLRRFEIWMWFHVWSKLLVSTGRAYSLRSGSQRADAEGREVMGRRFAQSLGVCVSY